jgi:signal transduction histidine kinase
LIEEGLHSLPGNPDVVAYLSDTADGSFRPVYRDGQGGPGSPLPTVARFSALARLLEADGFPLTRRILEQAVEDAHGEEGALASEALEQFRALGTELMGPLVREGRLVGWVGIGGGLPESYLTSEVSAELMVMANQAVAVLQRAEAVELAKRRQALAAVGEMAAGLAHEVRNPLGAIRGAAQFLVMEREGERAHEMLDVIQEETERLGRVVGEFLDYARPASPRREPVDLGEIVRRVLRVAEAAGPGLRAELSLAEGTPHALGDPDQIQRSFQNLVTNAREASNGALLLRIHLAPIGEGCVAIRFEDNGPGIAPEEIPRLFQPFHTTKRRGTGLGLALVHRIVEAHGGEIRIEGRPGQGAVFTLVLPAARSAS